MNRRSLRIIVQLPLSLCLLAVLPAFAAEIVAAEPGRETLRRVAVPEYAQAQEVRLDIGELILAGKVQPVSAIRTDRAEEKCWILRTPNGPPELRWPKNLLNGRGGVPDLTLDLGLEGVYDIYADVRAVHGDGSKAAELEDAIPMAFALELDDGSRREVVGAKGFPDRHFDLEVLACHQWDLTGRKIVLRGMGRPVYLSGFRLVPSEVVPPVAHGRKVMRWLATDHVIIAEDHERHLAFPGIARLANGDLVAVYREGTVHGYEPTGKVSLSRSTDGGRTWLARVTALDRPGIDDRDPSVFQTSGGDALLTSSDCLCTSSDFGHTWSRPQPTPVFGPHGAVEDDDGHIVYGGLKRVVQGELTRIKVHPLELALGRTGNSRPVCLQADAAYRSRDKGATWEPAGVAAYTVYMPGPTDYVWLDEPFLCVVPKTFWIFAARVDLDGFARIVRSPDRGKTWEPVIQTPVWGYPQHLLPLRDGRLLMSYGYRRAPLGVRACLSSDCGRTWDLDHEIVIRMDGGADGAKARVSDQDLGYPVSIELADGRILTVYYFNKRGSNCFIAGTFWNPPTTPLPVR